MKFKKKLEFHIFFVIITSLIAVIKIESISSKGRIFDDRYSSFVTTMEKLDINDDDLSMFTKDPEEESNDSLMDLPPLPLESQNKPKENITSDKGNYDSVGKVNLNIENNTNKNKNNDSEIKKLVNSGNTNNPDDKNKSELNKTNDNNTNGNNSNNNEVNIKSKENINIPSTELKSKPNLTSNQASTANSSSEHKENKTTPSSHSNKDPFKHNSMRFSSMINKIKFKSRSSKSNDVNKTVEHSDKKEDSIHEDKKDMKDIKENIQSLANHEVKNEVNKLNKEKDNLKENLNNSPKEEKKKTGIIDVEHNFKEKKVTITDNSSMNQVNAKDQINQFNNSFENTPTHNAAKLDNISSYNNLMNNNNNDRNTNELDRLNIFNKNGNVPNQSTPSKRSPWLNLLQVKEDKQESNGISSDNQSILSTTSQSNRLSNTEATLDKLTETTSSTDNTYNNSASSNENSSVNISDILINPADITTKKNNLTTKNKLTATSDDINSNPLNKESYNKSSFSNNKYETNNYNNNDNNIRNENNNNIEGIKLFSKLDTSFVQNLIQIQNDPDIKNILTKKNLRHEPNPYTNTNTNTVLSYTTNSSPPNGFDQREKINKNLLRNFYKPDAIDLSKLNYINNLIGNIRNEIQKKTIENDQLSQTYNQMDKNYEQLNGQLMILQTKFDSLLNEISIIKGIKNSQSIQTEKIKESNKILTDAKEFFIKISDDIASKSDSIEKYEKKVQNDLKNFNLEKSNLEKTFNVKSQAAEEFKKSYINTEKTKYQLLEKVKNYFEDFSKEEIKFLKLKNEENELQIELKNEENAEKLIALEIEHLKSTNMIEIQKIEELKQEIDKSKNMRDYLKKEIEELEDKLKNADNENKQNQVEYELKKNELEEKLNELKNEMKNEELLNNEEKEKYSKIESDIKNKISYVTLQNFNLLEPDNTKRNENKNAISGYNTNEQNVQDKNTIDNNRYSFKENASQLNRNENMQINTDINIDENSLKKQILMLLKKIND